LITRPWLREGGLIPGGIAKTLQQRVCPDFVAVKELLPPRRLIAPLPGQNPIWRSASSIVSALIQPKPASDLQGVMPEARNQGIPPYPSGYRSPFGDRLFEAGNCMRGIRLQTSHHQRGRRGPLSQSWRTRPDQGPLSADGSNRRLRVAQVIEQSPRGL